MYTLIPAYGSCCIPGDVVGTLSLRTISSHYLLTLAVRTAWSHCPFVRAVDDAPLCRPFATRYPRCQLTLPVTLPVRRRPSATPICAGHSRRAVHAADPRCSSGSASAGALRDVRLHWPFATPVRAADSHCPSHSPFAGPFATPLRAGRWRRLSALPTHAARRALRRQGRFATPACAGSSRRVVRAADSHCPFAVAFRDDGSRCLFAFPVEPACSHWACVLAVRRVCAPRVRPAAYHRPSAPFQGSPGTPKLGATRGSRARVM